MKTCWRSVLGLIVVLGCEPAEKNQEKEHVDASLAQDHASMVWVEGGEFMMGAHPGDQDALPREQPRHKVKVDGFFMDRHEVTNAQYAEFVESTGYVTVAERPVDTPQGSFDPGSMTFFSPEAIFSLRDPGQWWKWTESASWKCPEGPGSTCQEVLNHPVVHIAFEDAVAYATWRGARLPTEAEWEFAATARGEQVRFPWGNEAPGQGEVKCNIWEGPFPRVQHQIGWPRQDGSSHVVPSKQPRNPRLGRQRVGIVQRLVRPFHVCKSFRSGCFESKGAGSFV